MKKQDLLISNSQEINVRHLFLFTIVFLLVYVAGLFVDVMDVDAAQYASMSREMAETGNWLQLHNRYHDYLDKPPLLFWFSAASFKIFGIHNWSYKLPSFLFAILGIFSTAKLTENLYDKKTGAVAGVMVASALGIFIMTNDIRTDTMLFGSVAFSLWQLLVFVQEKKWIHLLGGFFGIGLAMLAKGPLGLVMPAMALGVHFIYKRQWRNIFRWEWLVGFAVLALLLLPMCIGLYRQFDLHPEKIINGHKGVSGLKFYFWTQSFGRVTGDSDWGTKYSNGADSFFFVHTFLWAFFPWSIFVVTGLCKNLYLLVKSRFHASGLPELVSTGGFLLVFLALSSSKYKLPHYLYVTFPLAAIIAAHFFVHDVMNASSKKLYRIFLGIHSFFALLLLVVSGIVLFYFFPGASPWIICTLILFLVSGVVIILKNKSRLTIILFPVLFALVIAYFTGDAHFYPRLLAYESPAQAGKIIVERKVPRDNFFILNDLFEHSLDYYSQGAPPYLYLSDTAIVNRIFSKYYATWVYTDSTGLSEINKSGYHIEFKKELEDYSVQFLTLNFLNPDTRAGVLRKRYLLSIRR